MHLFKSKIRVIGRTKDTRKGQGTQKLTKKSGYNEWEIISGLGSCQDGGHVAYDCARISLYECRDATTSRMSAVPVALNQNRVLFWRESKHGGGERAQCKRGFRWSFQLQGALAKAARVLSPELNYSIFCHELKHMRDPRPLVRRTELNPKP